MSPFCTPRMRLFIAPSISSFLPSCLEEKNINCNSTEDPDELVVIKHSRNTQSLGNKRQTGLQQVVLQYTVSPFVPHRLTSAVGQRCVCIPLFRPVYRCSPCSFSSIFRVLSFSNFRVRGIRLHATERLPQHSHSKKDGFTVRHCTAAILNVLTLPQCCYANSRWQNRLSFLAKGPKN